MNIGQVKKSLDDMSPTNMRKYLEKSIVVLFLIHPILSQTPFWKEGRWSLVNLCYFKLLSRAKSDYSLAAFSVFKSHFQQGANAVQEFKSLLSKVQVSEILISTSNHSVLVLFVINLVKGLWWQILPCALIT